MANIDSLPPIPTPPAQRWREFRIQILPVIIFLCILATIALMWRNFVQPSGVVGEVEAVKANVINLVDGVVAEMRVDRLQYVTNGQVIGTIISTEPELLKATIAAAEADLKVIQARMRLDERRNDQNVQQMRVDLWQEKLLLRTAMVNSNVAWTKLKRAQKLIDVQTQETLEIAQAEFDAFQEEIVARTQTIAGQEALIQQFASSQSGGSEPLIDGAIKAKELELELLAKPVDIKAPMDGVISAIYRRAHERVVRGEPIVTISSTTAERIVGYIRQPVQRIPVENDVVVIRTRTMKRQQGEGQILKVGAQFEVINPALVSTDSNRVEMGLPILISLPKHMTVSPGEFVDLSIRFAKK